jgi:hypothetical protein
MATPTIPNGEEYFFVTKYEGNGAGQRVGKFVPFTDNGTIANSVIFNDGDSPKLAITPSSNGNRRTWTFSAWIKRGVFGQKAFFSWDNTAPGGGGGGDFRFDSSHRLQLVAGGATSMYLISNRTFEDTSKYYHIYIKVDTTQSTASDRVEIYVDGDKITSFSTSTYPSQNKDFNINNTSYETRFGALNDNGSLTSYFDGYLAEVNFVDGTNPAVSTFGVTDTSTGRWIPKTLTGITYGTNGFRLKFQDSSALGDDTSGNGNDLSVTNLASTDQTTDSPTQLFATLQGTGGTLSEGNLKLVTGNSDFSHHNATLKPRSGKYYAEFTCDSMGRSEVGVVSTLNVPYSSNTTRLPATSDGSVAGYMYYGFNGQVYYNSSNSSDVTYATYTSTDIIGIALDLDNYTVQFFKNNSSQGTISLPNGNYTFAMGDGATGYSGGWTANFGQKSFTYTPPTGFVALQQDNLPETAKGISGLVWTKNRDAADNHQLYDSSRGKQKLMVPNTNAIESTVTDGLQKFLAGGQQIEDSDAINTSGESFVTWNWVANSGTTSTNTDGSLTSTVQVNQTAGFSIVQGKYFDGTLGHGLSQTPEWILYKEISPNVNNWFVFHKDLTSSNYFLWLNETNAQTNYGSTLFAPTSTTFATNLATVSNRDAIAYCWHSVDGFSKFGSYTGNGSADGPFVYTGFKPAWIMIKSSSNTTSWFLFDNKRNPINPAGKRLVADGTFVEDAGTTQAFDFLSNGFKLRNSSAGTNGSGRTYIYMAFAEHPFVGDGTSPVTAR